MSFCTTPDRSHGDRRWDFLPDIVRGKTFAAKLLSGPHCNQSVAVKKPIRLADVPNRLGSPWEPNSIGIVGFTVSITRRITGMSAGWSTTCAA